MVKDKLLSPVPEGEEWSDCSFVIKFNISLLRREICGVSQLHPGHEEEEKTVQSDTAEQ